MAEDTTNAAPPPPRHSKLPLVIGLVLLVVCAGVGFFAISQGLVPGLGAKAPEQAGADPAAPDTKDAASESALPEVAFVPLEPLVVSLQGADPPRFLRFGAILEVPLPHETDVTRLLPRITDALNSFLQAIDLQMVTDRDALLRLRVQMLHRVQLVVGQDRVRDVLIAEFVVN